jgi:hypothetical protein
MKISTPKPPKDLSKAAKQFWIGLRDEYDIRDFAGIDLLTDAARFYDRREQARVAIGRDGPTLTDRFGQVVAHPCVRIERDASASLMRCLKGLNLDLEPLHSKPGRPAGGR